MRATLLILAAVAGCSFDHPANVPSDAGADASSSDAPTDVAPAAASTAQLVSFSFSSATNPQLAVDITATINGGMISATLPFRSSLVGLKPTFSAIGTGVSIGGTQQISGVTSNDFSAPLVYTVTASDGSTTTYTTHIVVADPTTPAFTPGSGAGGNVPVAVATGDLNLDGLIDIATLDQDGSRVIVSVNTTTLGSGTTFVASFDQATHASPRDIAIADVNLDGMPDLLIASGNAVSILLNHTTPGSDDLAFANAVDFATGSTPVAIAVADFNGDGRIDVSTANAGDNTATVLINASAPGASAPAMRSPVALPVGATPSAIAAQDLDGDGRPDLVVTSSGDATASVLIDTTAAGAITATFAGQLPVTTGAGPSAVAIADLNGDGRPDLAVADATDNSVSLLLSTSLPSTAPAFAPAFNVSTVRNPQGIAILDVNNDGAADLVVTSQDANDVEVFEGRMLPGAATLSFTDATVFAAGGTPRDLAIADLDCDGRLDLVVANQSGTSFSMFHNDTPVGHALAFRPEFDISAGGAGPPDSIALADLDGDGKLDLIVSDGSMIGESGEVFVFHNMTAPGAAQPSFTASPHISGTVGGDPIQIAVLDLNGDGRSDVLVCNNALLADQDGNVPTGGTLAVMPSGGDETFERTLANNPFGIALGDVNLDGRADILSMPGSDFMVILNTTPIGSTQLSFGAETDITTPVQSLTSLTVGDFNGDGRPDVAVTDSSNVVSVAIDTTAPGGTTPTFASAAQFPVGQYPIAAVAGDVNGDGRQDLVVVNTDANSVSVLLGTTLPGSATPTFAPELELPVGGAPVTPVLADVDGDGRPDIVVPNQTSGGVSILVNTTPAGSTLASFAPVVGLALTGGGVNVAVGDLNGDGKPDVLAASYAMGQIAVYMAK
jgi:hypothetical protein